MLAFWLLKDNITMRERLMEYAKHELPKLMPPKQEVDRLRDALDALGVAIANAGYTWTPEMRMAYESVKND